MRKENGYVFEAMVSFLNVKMNTIKKGEENDEEDI